MNKSQLLKLYNTNLSIDKIAIQLSCSKSNIRYYITKYKLPLRLKKHQPLKTNDVIGNLTFVKYIGSTKKCANFKCKCGTSYTTNTYSVISGKTKSCGCLKKKRLQELNWNGFKQISGKFWHDFKKNAQDRNIKFDLTMKELWDIYIKQNKKCKLSNLDIRFPKNSNYTIDNKSTFSASVDRIDYNIGYIAANIQIIVKEINYMKRQMNNENFILMCKIINNHDNK